MNIDEKRNAIEENYINGNISDAKAMFKKLPKDERKSFASDRALTLGYLQNVTEGVRINTMNFADFLIRNI